MTVVRGLKHPTLVRVYGAGKNGPYFWIAMKFVVGESLAARLQRTGVAGRLDWRTTYGVAVSLARALHEIHQHGIIHRNLKPANVMIRANDRKAMLGDWSRARPMAGARVGPLPWPGQLVGDLTYLSPEQTQPGRVEDAKCDFYGMGATLYTLLAGRPPFEAGTVDKMVEKIRGEEPPRPKEFQLAIPEGLEGLVHAVFGQADGRPLPDVGRRAQGAGTSGQDPPAPVRAGGERYGVNNQRTEDRGQKTEDRKQNSQRQRTETASGVVVFCPCPLILHGFLNKPGLNQQYVVERA